MNDDCDDTPLYGTRLSDDIVIPEACRGRYASYVGVNSGSEGGLGALRGVPTLPGASTACKCCSGSEILALTAGFLVTDPSMLEPKTLNEDSGRPPMSFARRLRHTMRNAATAAISATPPAAAPTIAPMLLELSSSFLLKLLLEGRLGSGVKLVGLLL